MNVQQMQQLADAAAGRCEADLVLKNCRVVNVFSKGIIEGDIALQGGFIAGIGSYTGKHERDLAGSYVLPGFIDSHVHIESSLCTPEQFAAAVIPRGTVSVVADPHEIANVCGAAGILYMIEAAGRTPLKVHFMVPSCVPATPYETAGAEIDASMIQELLTHPKVLGLGEVMAYPQVVQGEHSILEKIAAAEALGKPVDGHGPGLSGKELSAYAASGILTDHECAAPEELLERIDRGMYVLLREGSAAKDLLNLLKGVTPDNAHRCLLCTDDRQPEDLLAAGHIDNHLRLAVSAGIDPVTAVQMATINSANCYGLTRQGAVAPGYRADLVVVDDLQDFAPRQVYIDGILRAQDGELIEPIQTGSFAQVTGTMHAQQILPKQLALKIPSETVRVIGLHGGSLVTTQVIRKVRRDAEGCFAYDAEKDICKLAVVERHHRSGNIGIGLIEGYGLKGGAIALSISHDSHNIIAAGDSDADIARAVNRVIELQGGIVLISRGETAGELALPVAGLMSDLPADQVRNAVRTIEQTARSTLQVTADIDPVMTLSFLALPVIPELKLTDQGLFDVVNFRHVGITPDSDHQ